MPPPGGCVIGKRNIDSHVEVLEAFGSTFHFDGDNYIATLNQAKPAGIFLKEASVTATENALLLGASVEKERVIDNAASEPHIGDLIEVLEKMESLLTEKAQEFGYEDAEVEAVSETIARIKMDLEVEFPFCACVMYYCY